MSYKNKLEIISNLVVDLYNHLPKTNKIIYVDGGELTGTTSLVNGVENVFKNTFISYEPSRDTKKKIIDTYGNGCFVSPDSEVISGIIEIFMEDRKVNQMTDESRTMICDRGILSTVIYQSGILDMESTLDDVKINCDMILKSAMRNEIKIPSIMVVLCFGDMNYLPMYMEAFKRRLNARIDNKEQEIDEMDDVAMAMTISRIYTDLCESVEYLLDNVLIHTIDFSLTKEEVVNEFTKIATKWGKLETSKL